MLPKGTIPTRTVTLSGGEVTIKGLTLAESKACGKAGDGGVELAVAYATGEPLEDVKAWLADAPAGDATVLLNAITDLSGLGQGAQFQK